MLFVSTVSGRLVSRYKHTDDVHNSGVVWGRLFHVHPALLQQVEVTVSVATNWDTQQLPFPITGKTLIYQPSTLSNAELFTTVAVISLENIKQKQTQWLLNEPENTEWTAGFGPILIYNNAQYNYIGDNDMWAKIKTFN